MLILTRKLGESINIGDQIKVTIYEINNNHVRIGIEAPKETKIYREEIYDKIMDENRLASQSRKDSVAKIATMFQELLKPKRGQK